MAIALPLIFAVGAAIVHWPAAAKLTTRRTDEPGTSGGTAANIREGWRYSLNETRLPTTIGTSLGTSSTKWYVATGCETSAIM